MEDFSNEKGRQKTMRYELSIIKDKGCLTELIAEVVALEAHLFTGLVTHHTSVLKQLHGCMLRHGHKISKPDQV